MPYKATFIQTSDAHETRIRVSDGTNDVHLHKRKHMWQVHSTLDNPPRRTNTEADRTWTAMVSVFESSLLAFVAALDVVWPITGAGNDVLLGLLADAVTTAVDAIANNFDD